MGEAEEIQRNYGTFSSKAGEKGIYWIRVPELDTDARVFTIVGFTVFYRI